MSQSSANNFSQKVKTYSCQFCSGSYTLRKTFLRHVRAKHRLRPYSCDVCKKTFILNKFLSRHKLKTNCSAYKKSKPRKKAVFSVTGDWRKKATPKMFSCSLCLQSLSSEKSLKDHMDSHSENKYLECDLCQEICASEKLLKKHCFDVHKIRKKPFKCNDCGSGYASKEGLAKHVCKIQKQPYFCCVCNKSYILKDDLFDHFFIHKLLQGRYLYA